MRITLQRIVKATTLLVILNDLACKLALSSYQYNNVIVSKSALGMEPLFELFMA